MRLIIKADIAVGRFLPFDLRSKNDKRNTGF